jgi:hypothetical protein
MNKELAAYLLATMGILLLLQRSNAINGTNIPREYSMNLRECNVTPGSTLTKVLKLITIRMPHDSPSFLFSPDLPPDYLPLLSSSDA